MPLYPEEHVDKRAPLIHGPNHQHYNARHTRISNKEGVARNGQARALNFDLTDVQVVATMKCMTLSEEGLNEHCNPLRTSHASCCIAHQLRVITSQHG